MNSSGSERNIATIPTPTAPTATELIGFSSFPGEIYQMILHRLPMTTVCSLLATCSDWQLRYLWLFSVEGGKQVDEIIQKEQDKSNWPANEQTRFQGNVAKAEFNNNPGCRAPHFLLAGPGGDVLYGKNHGFFPHPVLIQRLRAGTLSVSLSEIRERQQRWNVLETQLGIHRVQIGQGPQLPEIVHWLGEQISAGGTELGTTLTKCILDGSLPLTLAQIGLSDYVGTIDPTGFKRFQNILDIPCIKSALDNNEVSIRQLYEMAYCSFCPLENKMLGLVEICEDPRMQIALKSEAVKFAQLKELFFPDADLIALVVRIFFRLLQNDVVRTLLDTDVLKLTHLIELVKIKEKDGETCGWGGSTYLPFKALLNIFDLKAIQHHFISDVALGMQLMSLFGKDSAYTEKDRCLEAIFKCLAEVLSNPVIQKPLTDAVKGKQFLQQILELACQKGSWDHRLQELFGNGRYHDDFETEILDQLLHCPGLLKLNRALNTQVIQEGIEVEVGEASNLSLSHLIDLIVEEGKDLSNVSVLWYFFTKFAGKRTPSYAENCSQDLLTCGLLERFFYELKKFIPFAYPKIVLALMHSDVKQQVDEGKLNLQELSEELKGDPLSGYRLMLFGLSEYDASYKKRIEANFSDIFCQASLALESLTMDQFVKVIREQAQVTANSSVKPLWKIIHDLLPLLEQNFVSVEELLSAPYNVIAQLSSPQILSIDDKEPEIFKINADVSREDIRAIVGRSRILG
jgi:hypothetical protein